MNTGPKIEPETHDLGQPAKPTNPQPPVTEDDGKLRHASGDGSDGFEDTGFGD